MEVGFLDGAGGAIGICDGDEMATMEAFIVTAMVAGFVVEAQGAIGTCNVMALAWWSFLALAMEVLSKATED